MLKTKKVHHQPAFQDGCSDCHEPHGGSNDHLLRAKDANTLCLECHGPESPEPKPLKDQPLVAIFNGQVRLPENYFKQVPILPLKFNTGHPVEGHPVADVIDPKTKNRVPLTCLSCHQPHASAHSGLLVKDQQPDTAFCKTCHTEGTLKLR